DVAGCYRLHWMDVHHAGSLFERISRRGYAPGPELIRAVQPHEPQQQLRFEGHLLVVLEDRTPRDEPSRRMGQGERSAQDRPLDPGDAISHRSAPPEVSLG